MDSHDNLSQPLSGDRRASEEEGPVVLGAGSLPGQAGWGQACQGVTRHRPDQDTWGEKGVRRFVSLNCVELLHLSEFHEF